MEDQELKELIKTFNRKLDAIDQLVALIATNSALSADVNERMLNRLNLINKKIMVDNPYRSKG